MSPEGQEQDNAPMHVKAAGSLKGFLAILPWNGNLSTALLGHLAPGCNLVML